MAKRRARMEQRCVDLAIVLESLLAGDGRPDQIALTVRTRGAWLLGTNYEGRREVYDQINKLYAARSYIVHGGKAREGQIEISNGHWAHLSHIIPGATRLCERAVNHMIEASTDPAWTAIVLGRAEDQNQ